MLTEYRPLAMAECKFKCARQLAPIEVAEQAFNAPKWNQESGPKLTNYEVAYKEQNVPDPWTHAFNALKANNATLKNHYCPEGSTHALSCTW